MSGKDKNKIPYEDNPVIDYQDDGSIIIFSSGRNLPWTMNVSIIDRNNNITDFIAKRKRGTPLFEIPPSKELLTLIEMNGNITEIILPNYRVKYDFEDRFSHIDPSKKLLLIIHHQQTHFTKEARAIEKQDTLDFINLSNKIYKNNVINLTGLSTTEIIILAAKFKDKFRDNLKVDFAMFSHHGYFTDFGETGPYSYGSSQLTVNKDKATAYPIIDDELFSGLTFFSDKKLNYGLFLSCQNDPINAKHFKKGCFMAAIFEEGVPCSPVI